MYVKIKKNKFKVRELNKFTERFVSYKFYLKPIKDVLRFPHKRWFTTYLYCQRVDIVMTDKNNKILYMYPNLNSEKKIWPKRGVYYTYVFPAKSTSCLRVGDTLKLKTSSSLV